MFMNPMMGQPMGGQMPSADPLAAAADPLALYRMFMQQQAGMGPQMAPQGGGGMGGMMQPPAPQQPPQRGLGGFQNMGLMDMAQLRGMFGGGQQFSPKLGGMATPETTGGLLGMFQNGGAKGLAEMGGGIMAAQPGYGLI